MAISPAPTVVAHPYLVEGIGSFLDAAPGGAPEVDGDVCSSPFASVRVVILRVWVLESWGIGGIRGGKGRGVLIV